MYINNKELEKPGEQFNPMTTLLIEKDVAETGSNPDEISTDRAADLTIPHTLESSMKSPLEIHPKEIFKAMKMFLSDPANLNNYTIRDFYAIVHNKPVSNKHWLNALIISKHE